MSVCSLYFQREREKKVPIFTHPTSVLQWPWMVCLHLLAQHWQGVRHGGGKILVPLLLTFPLLPSSSPLPPPFSFPTSLPLSLIPFPPPLSPPSLPFPSSPFLSLLAYPFPSPVFPSCFPSSLVLSLSLLSPLPFPYSLILFSSFPLSFTPLSFPSPISIPPSLLHSPLPSLTSFSLLSSLLSSSLLNSFFFILPLLSL